MAKINNKESKKKTFIASSDIEKEEIVKNISNELTTKVKNNITKEIIDDIKSDIKILVKEEVKEDLKKDIEIEIKNDNKRIIRKKRGKIFFRDIIIVLLLILIGFLVYFMYKQGNFSIIINDNSKNTIVTTKEVSNISNEEDYAYLINNVKVNLPVENINAFYIYTDIYDESSINYSIKLNIAYKNINKEEFSDDEMKNSYESIFGTLKNYKSGDFDYNCKHFNYDSKNSKYKLASDDCIKLSNKEIKEKITKITKEEDLIYIETVMGVYDSDNNSLYDFQNLYRPVAVNVIKNLNLDDYKDYLSSYKYTFKYIDGTYHFNKIVKLN